MDDVELSRLLLGLAAHLDRLGMDVEPVHCSPPATEADVALLEHDIGVALPPSFREALLTLSGDVSFRWSIPASLLQPAPFDVVSSGQLWWSVELTEQAERDRRHWASEVFPDLSDPYDAVWHHKLGISPVGNGDIIALDLHPERLGQVVYLSHDGDEAHGYVMAESVVDLVARLAPLAFVGPEGWQWRDFCSTAVSGIEPDGGPGRGWHERLALERVAPLPDLEPRSIDQDLVASLFAAAFAEPGTDAGHQAARRALQLCGRDRLDDVMRLTYSDDMWVQEDAINVLRRWKVDALERFVEVARSGTHNGRIAALAAIRELDTPEAWTATASLEEELGPDW